MRHARISSAETGLIQHARPDDTPIEKLLPLLENVRGSNHGSWRADCPNPTHEWVKGSLAVTATTDGTLLINCFACHDTRSIQDAMGLELADLFPDRIKDTSPEGHCRAREVFKRNSWQAALGVFGRESTVLDRCARSGRRQGALRNRSRKAALATDRIWKAQEALA